MTKNMNFIALAAIAVVAILGIAAATPVLQVYAGDVNPAHDADNGGGNEGSLGQCKQEANNDDSCKAKFP
jgi:hypothetical protein